MLFRSLRRGVPDRAMANVAVMAFPSSPKNGWTSNSANLRTPTPPSPRQGEPLGDDARPFVEAMAKEEGRVVLSCTPYATFATQPRHLHRNDHEEKVPLPVAFARSCLRGDPSEMLRPCGLMVR